MHFGLKIIFYTFDHLQISSRLSVSNHHAVQYGNSCHAGPGKGKKNRGIRSLLRCYTHAFERSMVAVMWKSSPRSISKRQ